MTLWGGRVEVRLAPEVWEFLRAHDAELLPYDCQGTLMHARRLHAGGLLGHGEFADVASKLDSIREEGFAFLADSEDVQDRKSVV